MGVSHQNYPTDLTDSQWEHIKELLPAAKARGRPRELDPREVLNAIFYVVAGGIQGSVARMAIQVISRLQVLSA